MLIIVAAAAAGVAIMMLDKFRGIRQWSLYHRKTGLLLEWYGRKGVDTIRKS